MSKYKVVLEIEVDNNVKHDNDRKDWSDRDYIESELGWAQSSFTGMDIQSVEEIKEPEGKPFFKFEYDRRRGEQVESREVTVQADNIEQAIRDWLDHGFPKPVPFTLENGRYVKFPETDPDPEGDTTPWFEDDHSFWVDFETIYEDIVVTGPFVKSECSICGTEILQEVKRAA